MIETTLYLAIAKGCRVRLIYLKDDQPEMRFLIPKSLNNDKLLALDIQKRQVRSFSLNKILAVELVSEEA